MENDAVKQILADLDRGIVPAPDVISYEFKGVMKYAAFVVLTNQSILVMTADENDVLHGVSEMTRYMIIGGGLLIFISMVLILLTIGYMLRAVDDITEIVRATSKFKQPPSPSAVRLNRCRTKQSKSDCLPPRASALQVK